MPKKCPVGFTPYIDAFFPCFKFSSILLAFHCKKYYDNSEYQNENNGYQLKVYAVPA